MATFRITAANSVLTTGTNQHAFDTDTSGRDILIVDADGSLETTGLPADGAVLGAQGSWKVAINGLVRSAARDGLVLEANNTAASSIGVGKTGEVLGSHWGMKLSSAANVSNAGLVKAGLAGIFLDGTGPFIIKNTGTIEGGIHSIRAFASNVEAITNGGTLLGDVLLLGGADRLINKGTIEGMVSMGDDDDQLANAKLISGDVLLGTGDDRMTNSGEIGGSLHASDGDDTIKNSGKVHGALNMGDGLNALANSGLILGGVTGGNQRDVVKNSGTIAGVVDLGAGDDIYTGGGKADGVIDSAGSDIVKLGGGDDTYEATLASGVDGTDVIDGGAGIGDTYSAMFATSGIKVNLDKIAHDFSPFAPGVLPVEAYTATGADIGGAFKDTIKGFEHVIGGSGADVIYGNAAANQMQGGAEHDLLAGFGGADRLWAGSGFDTIYGGAGQDTMSGGDDGDTFWFAATSDSGVTEATRDVILDFEAGDHIQLSAIDANTANGAATNDAFSFIGTNVGFSGTAGELRAVWSDDGQIVEGDVNGDGKADLSILLLDPSHSYMLTQTDFVL